MQARGKEEVAMGANGKQYTAGTWVVKEGSEAEFIARWEEFTGWSLANAPGAHHFVLIREEADPRRFLSFGAWDDRSAVDAWRGTAEFQQRLAACRELCDDFKGTDHTLAAAVGGSD
jgi:heme-degrading monooxygenase HmoA